MLFWKFIGVRVGGSGARARVTGFQKEYPIALKGQRQRSSSLPGRKRKRHLGKGTAQISYGNVKLRVFSEVEQVEANG